ncbi:MAG: hypothetical protein P0Y64_00735 [Candidatus Sphingomonas colombiensis]|nr:hypothetical protein [Sphingomonas sp.]WEK45123.1 MAG: hypothetical protein P0Y64_00735 [Sphingomonas sp.]
MFVALLIKAPPSQELEPPANPAQFSLIENGARFSKTTDPLQNAFDHIYGSLKHRSPSILIIDMIEKDRD